MSTLTRVVAVPLARQGRTLAELVPVFLNWFEFIRRRSPNTIASYEFALQSFLEFCAQAELTAPGAVTFRYVETYLGWLMTVRGLKASSANHHLHAVRSLFRYLLREGITATNPALDCFRLPERRPLPCYLSIEEQDLVLTTLAADSSLLGRRDYALIATALLTALRCAELSALQVAHVNLGKEDGRLRVINGKGGKDREVPIIPRLAAILRGYLDEVRPALLARPLGNLRREGPADTWKVYQKVDGRNVYHNLGTQDRAEAERLRAELIPLPAPPPFLFINAHHTGANRLRHAGQALGTKAIYNLVQRVVSPIVGHPVYPHMLRHSLATRLYEKGADLVFIRDILGHASITTTTIYTHVSTKRQRQELARLLE